MEYTVKKLALLAGVSARTIRYYDKIGLLKPCRINSSGYRIYNTSQLNQLQEIMFYKTLGFELTQIQEIISDPSYNRLNALKSHLNLLQARRSQIDLLINNVSKTILNEKGEIEMTDQEKFSGLKESLINENESKYGQELRDTYGHKAIEKSNKHFSGMSKESFDHMQSLSLEINQALEAAVKEHRLPAGPEGQRIAGLHKEWITMAWGWYSEEAHQGVVQLYIDDPRFTQYYDASTAGCAQFLHQAVTHMLKV